MGNCAACFQPQNPPLQKIISQTKSISQPRSELKELDIPLNRAQTLVGSKNKRLNISDFRIEKCLGKGAFGKVYLVRMQKSKGDKLYAMKVMRKQDIIQNNLVENIHLEKLILQKSKHPFLVQLKYAFQTDIKLYLVMEYVPGGELFTLLRRQKSFPDETVKFYAA